MSHRSGADRTPSGGLLGSVFYSKSGKEADDDTVDLVDGSDHLLFLVNPAAIVTYTAYKADASNHTNAPKPAPTAPKVVSLPVDVEFDGLAFTIKNLGKSAWGNIRADLNGGVFSSGYIYETDYLGAGATMKVGALNFAKSDGTRFNPLALKPESLAITATLADGSQGAYRVSFR